MGRLKGRPKGRRAEEASGGEDDAATGVQEDRGAGESYQNRASGLRAAPIIEASAGRVGQLYFEKM